MENKPYELLSSRQLRAARFTVTEDELKLNGAGARYSFVNIRPGICVIIETPQGFAVLREYRYPIKRWSYEFAAGIIDEGETAKEAALREAEEETGYIADEITELGEFYPSFGATDEVIHLFHAFCTKKDREEHEVTEMMTCELKSAEEIEEMMISGEFRHGAGLAAWLKFILHRKQGSVGRTEQKNS